MSVGEGQRCKGLVITHISPALGKTEKDLDADTGTCVRCKCDRGETRMKPKAVKDFIHKTGRDVSPTRLYGDLECLREFKLPFHFITVITD